MLLSEFEPWYRTRYHRTTSAVMVLALVISDIIGVLISFGTGFFLINLYNIHAINFRSFITYWPYLFAFTLVFYAIHLYPGISLAPAEELRRFTIASIIVHGGIILSRYIEDQAYDAISSAFVISFCFSTIFLLICRSTMRTLLRKSGIGGIPAVIYGGGGTSRLVVDRLLNNREIGYIPVLILDNDPEQGDEYHGVPVIHDTSIGPELVKQFNIKMAIVTSSKMDRRALTQLLNYSVSAFRYNVLIPDFFSIANIWVSIRDFDGILGFATTNKLKMFWNLGIKRFLDLFIVFAGGIIISPALLLFALLVKISSPGPVLYGHTRLGLNGRPFTAYKFRSMVVDAEKQLEALLESDPEAREQWEKNHKLKKDPRITAVGRFLRRTSIDEFPQLINIIKGEMSLVGPRPIVREEVKKYGGDFDRIFSIKPGLTGLWQVSGRSDTDYVSRVSFDTYYLQNWSVWLDLWILYKTTGVVFKGKGAY